MLKLIGFSTISILLTGGLYSCGSFKPETESMDSKKRYAEATGVSVKVQTKAEDEDIAQYELGLAIAQGIGKLGKSPGAMGNSIATEESFNFNHFALQYGIKLAGRGGKEFDGVGTSITHKKYLILPTYLLYNHELQNSGLVFGGLGPYIGYGLWGKTIYKDPATGNQSYPTFDKNNGYRRFDAGLGLLAGYQIPDSFRFSIGYDIGLVNNEHSKFTKVYNRALRFSVGYPLDKIIDKIKKK